MFWEFIQKVLEILIRLNVIRPGRFGDAVYDSTGLSATNCVNGAPVFLPETECQDSAFRALFTYENKVSIPSSGYRDSTK